MEVVFVCCVDLVNRIDEMKKKESCEGRVGWGRGAYMGSEWVHARS